MRTWCHERKFNFETRMINWILTKLSKPVPILHHSRPAVLWVSRIWETFSRAWVQFLQITLTQLEVWSIVHAWGGGKSPRDCEKHAQRKTSSFFLRWESLFEIHGKLLWQICWTFSGLFTVYGYFFNLKIKKKGNKQTIKVLHWFRSL